MSFTTDRWFYVKFYSMLLRIVLGMSHFAVVFEIGGIYWKKRNHFSNVYFNLNSDIHLKILSIAIQILSLSRVYFGFNLETACRNGYCSSSTSCCKT